MSATIPTQTAITLILLRIFERGITQWLAALIKLDIMRNFARQIAHSFSIRQLDRASRDLSCLIKLASLRVGRGKCPNVNGIVSVREMVGFEREIQADFILSKRIIRPGRDEPGEVIQRVNQIRIGPQRLFIMIGRFAQQTFLDERVREPGVRAGVVRPYRQHDSPLANRTINVALLEKRGSKIVMTIGIIGPQTTASRRCSIASPRRLLRASA